MGLYPVSETLDALEPLADADKSPFESPMGIDELPEPRAYESGFEIEEVDGGLNVSGPAKPEPVGETDGGAIPTVTFESRGLFGTLILGDRSGESADEPVDITVESDLIDKLHEDEGGRPYTVGKKQSNEYDTLLLTRRSDAPANLLYALTIRAEDDVLDFLLQDGWNDTEATARQVSFVFAEYAYGSRDVASGLESFSSENPRKEAKIRVADSFEMGSGTIMQKCGGGIWDIDLSPGENYQDDYLRPALEAFDDVLSSDFLAEVLLEGWNSVDVNERFGQLPDFLGEDDHADENLWTDSDEILTPTEIDPENTPKLPETDLCFPDSLPDSFLEQETLLQEIDAAIRAGDHLILTGPPGSGKTKLADDICDHYADDHNVATATSDWTTFDTVGGYRPARDGDGLRFVEGLFLDCFDTDENGKAKNEWLVVDELNRADVDKAFGSLFTVLTGENVELPFLKQMQDADSVDTDSELRGNTSSDDEEKVKIIGDPDEGAERQPHEYRVPSDWRLIATMNAVDKASLYRMSYAFVRRFSFVTVPVPSADDLNTEAVQEYLDTWVDIDEYNFEPVDLGNHDSPKEKLAADTALVWETARKGAKPFGPGVIEDFVEHALAELQTTGELGYDQALAAHVLPQFEGREQEVDGFLSEIEDRGEPPEIDGERDTLAARQFAASHLGVDDAAPGGD